MINRSQINPHRLWDASTQAARCSLFACGFLRTLFTLTVYPGAELYIWGLTHDALHRYAPDSKVPTWKSKKLFQEIELRSHEGSRRALASHATHSALLHYDAACA